MYPHWLEVLDCKPCPGYEWCPGYESCPVIGGTVHCTLGSVVVYSKGSLPTTRTSDLWDVKKVTGIALSNWKKGFKCSVLSFWVSTNSWVSRKGTTKMKSNGGNKKTQTWQLDSVDMKRASCGSAVPMGTLGNWDGEASTLKPSTTNWKMVEYVSRPVTLELSVWTLKKINCLFM